LPEGATATDLVLTVTQMLRKKGVVGKFVEFYGDRAFQAALSWPIAPPSPTWRPNMARPSAFSHRREDARLSAMTNATPRADRLVEAYTKEQGLFRTDGAPEPEYSDKLELDLASDRGRRWPDRSVRRIASTCPT
jgi:aconitate hydratase